MRNAVLRSAIHMRRSFADHTQQNLNPAFLPVTCDEMSVKPYELRANYQSCKGWHSCRKICLKKGCECTARNLNRLFTRQALKRNFPFSRRSSSQLPALDNKTPQHSSAHISCRCAPIFNESSTSKREGWSARLDSVGTLANQANCNSVSKDKTTTKIFLATAFCSVTRNQGITHRIVVSVQD